MFARNLVTLSSFVILSGCTSYEGLYAPACVAYAGSEIRLDDGRYVWTRFTDQVVVDENGNEVDPFPGFPRRGQYKKQDYQITLLGADGEPVHTLFLFRFDGDMYLYTAEETDEFESTGERPSCPLNLQAPGT